MHTDKSCIILRPIQSGHILTSKIPLLSGSSRVLKSNGELISMEDIKSNTILMTNSGPSAVVKVLKIQYSGPVYSTALALLTPRTIFLSKYGYSDYIENMSNRLISYTGTLYNVILQNREMLTLINENDGRHIYISSCGFRTEIPRIENSLFQNNEFVELILSSFSSFEVTLLSEYFWFNLETSVVEFHRSKILRDRNVQKSPIKEIVGYIGNLFKLDPISRSNSRINFSNSDSNSDSESEDNEEEECVNLYFRQKGFSSPKYPISRKRIQVL